MKLFKKVICIGVVVTLLGCSSSAAKEANKVTKAAEHFMKELSNGNLDGAMEYADASLQQEFQLPELEEAKDALTQLGLDQEAQQEFQEFIDSIFPRILKEGIRAYKIEDAQKVSYGEYRVPVFLEMADFPDVLDLNLDDILNADMQKEMMDLIMKEGVEKAVKYLVSELVTTMTLRIDEALHNADSVESETILTLKRYDGKWLISDIEGFTD